MKLRVQVDVGESGTPPPDWLTNVLTTLLRGWYGADVPIAVRVKSL